VSEGKSKSGCTKTLGCFVKLYCFHPIPVIVGEWEQIEKGKIVKRELLLIIQKKELI
jgi:hypothetical protein